MGCTVACVGGSCDRRQGCTPAGSVSFQGRTRGSLKGSDFIGIMVTVLKCFLVISSSATLEEKVGQHESLEPPRPNGGRRQEVADTNQRGTVGRMNAARRVVCRRGTSRE